MDKVTYTTDTTAALPSTFLSAARWGLAATGNSTAGYFGGGTTPGPTVATMDKVTYSSDTMAAAPGASLSVTRSNYAATGNSTAGYFGGGLFYTTMDKVTYASDTTAAVPGANLSVARGTLAATGNSTHGYFGGGLTPGPNVVATMDKIQYSTDTRLPAIPGADLSIARIRLAATGNSEAGYFGGGCGTPGSPKYTTIDKITYSNDTRSIVPSVGSLSNGRDSHAATGNSTAGYFAGGVAPNNTA